MTLGVLQTKIVTCLTVFIMSLFMVIRSVPNRMSQRFSRQSGGFPKDLEFKEGVRPRSPSQHTENGTLLYVSKRLHELEEKVHALEAKPSQLPLEKEEMLSAAVCRVDALEAELISTKKVPPVHKQKLVLHLKKYSSPAMTSDRLLLGQLRATPTGRPISDIDVHLGCSADKREAHVTYVAMSPQLHPLFGLDLSAFFLMFTILVIFTKCS
jgi:hypothetical protein